MFRSKRLPSGTSTALPSRATNTRPDLIRSAGVLICAAYSRDMVEAQAAGGDSRHRAWNPSDATRPIAGSGQRPLPQIPQATPRRWRLATRAHTRENALRILASSKDDIARSQDANSWELRAVIYLADVRHSQGKTSYVVSTGAPISRMYNFADNVQDGSATQEHIWGSFTAALATDLKSCFKLQMGSQIST